MKKPPSMTTVAGAADLFERDRATLVRCMRGIKPDRIEGTRQFFKVATIFKALLEHLLKTTGGMQRSVTDQHTRLAAAKAEKAEMEVAQKRGELVEAEVVANLLEAEYRVIAERLLSIAAVASDKIEPNDIARREVARSIIEAFVHEALVELSAPADLLEQSVNGRDRRGGRLGGNGGITQQDDKRDGSGAPGGR